jgi:type IV secretory pathway VirJ component
MIADVSTRPPVQARPRSPRRIVCAGVALGFIALTGVAHATRREEPVPPRLADLPLVVFPIADPPRDAADVYALLMTGDGGWAKLARDLSAGLLAAGIPVVGFNSRRYFHVRRTPEQTAQDVERVLEQYAQAWGRRRILLIGYSRGADVLPFVINRLDASLRARIALAALLNPATETRFVVDAGADARHDLPLQPEVSSLDGATVLCAYGLGDHHALCPTLDADRYDVLAVGRGHHFGGQYDVLVDAILSRVRGADAGAAH